MTYERDISAVIVTRGDVDLSPILATLPYEDVVVWDNSARPFDAGVFGRYLAMLECRNEVVYCQDDDVVFERHAELAEAWQPGRVIGNMTPSWVRKGGYEDLVLMACGGIVERELVWPVFRRYLAHWPYDREFLLTCDFVLGVLAPWLRIDLGWRALPWQKAKNRLAQSPAYQLLKARDMGRARAVRDAGAP